MAVTGYLTLEGTCYGDDLKSIDASLNECRKQCDSHSDCRGFNYILKKIKCILKSIMCTTPTTSGDGRGTIAYYKIDNEGKLLHLCKI